jgi:hypothetical protein
MRAAMIGWSAPGPGMHTSGTPCASAAVTLPCPPWVIMRLVLGRIAWCGSQAVTAAFGGGERAGRDGAGGHQDTRREVCEGVEDVLQKAGGWSGRAWC